MEIALTEAAVLWELIEAKLCLSGGTISYSLVLLYSSLIYKRLLHVYHVPCTKHAEEKMKTGTELHRLTSSYFTAFTSHFHLAWVLE